MVPLHDLCNQYNVGPGAEEGGEVLGNDAGMAMSFGRSRRVPRPRALLSLAALLALALAACSDFSTDDLLAWRQGMVKEVAGAIPGTDQPYPNLATVPEKAPAGSSKAARVELQKKLEADNKATGYVPDKANAPEIPSPPAALPPGFVEAEQPVQLADAGLPGGTAAALGPPGEPRRVAVVLFAEGSAAIDSGQIGKLKPILDAVRRDGGTLHVVGHASQTGDGLDQTKVDNFDLSVERADAVAKALGELGLESNALQVSAEGDSKPVVAVAGAKGEAANRRVDIFYGE